MPARNVPMEKEQKLTNFTKKKKNKKIELKKETSMLILIFGKLYFKSKFHIDYKDSPS